MIYNVVNLCSSEGPSQKVLISYSITYQKRIGRLQWTSRHSQHFEGKPQSECGRVRADLTLVERETCQPKCPAERSCCSTTVEFGFVDGFESSTHYQMGQCH